MSEMEDYIDKYNSRNVSRLWRSFLPWLLEDPLHKELDPAFEKSLVEWFENKDGKFNVPYHKV